MINNVVINKTINVSLIKLVIWFWKLFVLIKKISPIIIIGITIAKKDILTPQPKPIKKEVNKILRILSLLLFKYFKKK